MGKVRSAWMITAVCEICKQLFQLLVAILPWNDNIHGVDFLENFQQATTVGVNQCLRTDIVKHGTLVGMTADKGV